MRRLEPGTGGVVAVAVEPCGARLRVAECADCGRVMTILQRGLCAACRKRHRKAGTIGEFGQDRAGRLAEYAALRPGLSVAEAAAQVGVAKRTAERYEAELRKAVAHGAA